jgi:hypothetical protein
MPRLPRNTCPNIDEVIDFLKTDCRQKKMDKMIMVGYGLQSMDRLYIDSGQI